MLPVASGGAWHTAAFLSINTFIYFQIVCRAAATWYIRCAPLNQIEQMNLKDFFFRVIVSFKLYCHSKAKEETCAIKFCSHRRLFTRPCTVCTELALVNLEWLLLCIAVEQILKSH